MVRADRLNWITAAIDPQTFSRELQALLPPFLAGQRWYAAVDDPVLQIRRIDTLQDGWPTLLWLLVEVRGSRGRGEPTWYQVPLGAVPEWPDHLPESAMLGRLETSGGGAYLLDPLADENLALAFAHVVAPDLRPKVARLQGGEQSNTSVVLDEHHIMKVFRRVQPGANPDVEVTEALGRWVSAVCRFRLQSGAQQDRLAVVRRYERSRGDGFELASASLREMLNRKRPPRECKLDFAKDAHLLGENVAHMHVALAEAFGSEPAEGLVGHGTCRPNSTGLPMAAWIQPG